MTFLEAKHQGIMLQDCQLSFATSANTYQPAHDQKDHGLLCEVWTSMLHKRHMWLVKTRIRLHGCAVWPLSCKENLMLNSTEHGPYEGEGTPLPEAYPFDLRGTDW